MTAWQFDNMARLVAELRPELDAGGVRHACNVVGNELRGLKTDVYDVQLSNEQQAPAAGYYIDRPVEVRGRALWLRVWVD